MDDRKHIQTIIERKCIGSSFCTQTPPTLDYSGGRVNLFCVIFFTAMVGLGRLMEFWIDAAIISEKHFALIWEAITTYLDFALEGLAAIRKYIPMCTEHRQHFKTKPAENSVTFFASQKKAVMNIRFSKYNVCELIFMFVCFARWIQLSNNIWSWAECGFSVFWLYCN